MAIYQKYVKAPEQPQVFKLRPEQEEAIMLAKQRFFNYSDTKTKGIVFKEKRSGQQKFLWNAKMRFGKTVCALQLVKDCEFKRTLILTHRPVVDSSWYEDFTDHIFKDCDNYTYAPKDAKLAPYEENLENNGVAYIYFASMQDLRGSEEVGGKFSKNDNVFSTKWDCIIIDEAHEGTKTELGEAVLKSLLKADTKLLQLSGTPFNLYEEFGPDEIFTWDYIREQKAKAEWNDEDGPNPYATLPKLKIFTYKMMHLVDEDNDGNGEFKFKDFFRVVTKKDDPRRGRFVNEDNVKKFLNKMCTPGDSNYPFTTAAYQNYFKHTLWIVPGVKEAKALEHLLNEHIVFKNFRVVNVAGTNDDDELKDSALENVKKAIKDTSRPYTITLSCGRLTTGVTVPEWTAVFYLKGSENTKASTYLQTIFRVQSPHVVGDMMKSECYVFDFAPERTLQMMAETASFSRKIEKKGKKQISDQEDIEKMEELLEYMPVTSLKDGKMEEFDYKAANLFGKLENVYADRVARHGFADPNLYNVGILDNLTPEQKDTLIETLKILGGPTKVKDAPKDPQNDIVVNSQDKNDLTPEEKVALEEKKAKEAEEARLLKEAKAKARKEAWENLTPEEQERIERDRAEKAEKRKQRKQNEAILAGISIRVPLMMYGADVTNEKDDITVNNFTEKIDDDSWKEFMPKNVTKDLFNKLKIFYNPTIFKEAGKRYRVLAQEADFMTVEERIQRITEIFSWFKDPDKETVLTPWDVVNRHMSDCLGGYCFYNEDYSKPLVIEKKESTDENGNVTVTKPTVEPRLVNVEGVTEKVFGNPDKAKILEINSKSGLYPLYIAYSLYRKRFEQYTMHDLWDKMSVEETQVAWDHVLKDNIYVVCNTEMAARITRRTLLGYRKENFEPNIKFITNNKINGLTTVSFKNLIDGASETFRKELITHLNSEGFWKNDSNKTSKMNFSAVVGNPPYQETISTDVGNRALAKQLYPDFIQLSILLSPHYVSLITPLRWFTADAQDGSFPKLRSFVQKNNNFRSYYSYNGKKMFPSTELTTVGYFLWDKKHSGKVLFVENFTEEKNIKLRPLFESAVIKAGNSIIIPLNDMVSIVNAVVSHPQFVSFMQITKGRDAFGIVGKNIEQRTSASKFVGATAVRCAKEKIRYIQRSMICQEPDILNMVDSYKIFTSKANGGAGTLSDGKAVAILGKAYVGEKNTACTDSLIPIGCFKTIEEAIALQKYMSTRFLRFMVGVLKASQNLYQIVYRFVPLQDFTSNSDIDWQQDIDNIDKQLIKKYGIQEYEKTINAMIKPFNEMKDDSE